MKTLLFTTLLLFIGIIAPCCAQAQKYHDAAIEDAKGPVRTIKEGTRTLQYSPDGKLLSINGVVPYEKETRNDQGYLCAATGELYNGSFEYNANNRLSAKRTYKLFGGGHYTYTYNSEGQCVRCDILEDGVPTIIIEYSAIRTDSHGNWIERKNTTKALNERTGEWDIEPAKTQTRTITYYENTPATPATPAKQPGELSVTDMVNHPFGVLSTNISYQSALQALRQHKEWEVDATNQLISVSNLSGYKRTHDGLPVSSVSAFFMDDHLRSFDFEFDFLKGDDEQAALAKAKAAAERMVSRLREAGIILTPQENSSHELYYAKGQQGDKTIEISVREASYTAVRDCYRLFFEVTMH